MLQIHKRVAESMGMDPNSICVAENGSVIELTTKHMKCETSVPAGEVFVDGSGVGDVGAVVLNDRKLLAEDGMVVIVLPMSSHDHRLLCQPEIVTGLCICQGIRGAFAGAAGHLRERRGRHVCPAAEGPGRGVQDRPRCRQQLSVQAYQAQPHGDSHGDHAVSAR